MENKTQTTLERIIKTITLGIENGTFATGSALPAQRQLAEYFDVSRSVIREAVKVLEGSGLLYSKQGSGIYVLPRAKGAAGTGEQRDGQYTLRDILHLCRMVWHTVMLDVANDATEKELERLQKRTEKMLETYTTSSIHRKFIYESSFGMSICQLSDNSLAYDLMRELLKASTLIDYKIITHPDYNRILEIDLKIVEALRQRNAFRAYFWGNERDVEIEKLIVGCEEIMEKKYSIAIKQ